MTVFVTTHYMDEALNCERIVMINEGRIVAIGPPSKIISDILPDRPDADLNDAFVRLMARSSH
jgi:ABC-2 type transport system ATP-binding protein